MTFLLDTLSEITYNMPMERDEDLERMQEAVGVSDEEVAARAKMSSKTFQRAKRLLVPSETRQAFVEALESLRLERRAQVSRPFGVAQSAG